MSKKTSPGIDEIIRRKLLVEFNRKPLEKTPLFGFILAWNSKFTLIHYFDRDLFILNGYCVFQNDSVKNFAVYDDPDYFLSEVITLKKIKPKPANISIESWAEILQSVAENFPLIVIEQEKITDKVCHIGKLKKLQKNSFTLSEIDTSAEWDKSYSYKFENLTKVGFDGLYENMLAFVAENRDRLNKKKS
jgi:hypothetical protein